MKKAVVLLSGGLDSTVNIFRASRELNVVLAVTFNYGQRAFINEKAAAQKICKILNIPHRVVDVEWFKEFTQTSLVNIENEVPTEQVKIDDLNASQESAKAVWVPNRNGIFLNIAAGFAEGLGAQYVIPGFNKEEAATFADNSASFMHALDASFAFSTQNGVQVKCYTTDLDKTAIVGLGRSLGIDMDLIWPCYFSGTASCGKCESCLRFKRACQS